MADFFASLAFVYGSGLMIYGAEDIAPYMFLVGGLVLLVSSLIRIAKEGLNG